VLIAAGAVVFGAVVLVGAMASEEPAPPAPAPAVADVQSEPATSDEEPAFEADASVAATPARSFEAMDATRSAAAAYASGDFAAAQAAAEAAVAASPEDAEARNTLGQVLVRQGRAAEALPHFDQAVRLDDQRWAYRFNRARAYGLVNRWPEAVVEYRAAAQILPDDHVTLYNLGLALLRVRDYGAAVVSLEQAVAAAPDQHDFLITLGTAYVGAAQPDRARQTFERFLELAPEHAEASKVKSLLQALDETAP
jgi:tetratricopeptide (TPR) repeat protein